MSPLSKRSHLSPLLLAAAAAVAPALAHGVTCPAEAGSVDLTQPPYSAKRDGAADTSAAFRKAMADPKVRTICLPPGEYRIDQQVTMRSGQETTLLGLSSDPGATRIVWRGKLIPFFSVPTQGVETRVRRFAVRNLTFDGQQGHGRALNLLAVPGAVDSSVVIENSVFQDMTNLPIWLEGFDRVRIAGSKFLRTKDPGILRSNNVEIVDNEAQDISDNCFSVSRGNANVRVAGNKLRNCRSAGIFVGGINYEGDRQRGFALEAPAGAAAGAACMLRTTGGDFFRHGMIGTHLTLRRGADFAIVQISGWDEADQRAAPCRVVTPVPASLARRATHEWSDGPHFGGEGGVVENNDIAGTRGHGITLSLGVRGVKVRHNTIRMSGSFREGNGEAVEKPSFGIMVLGWYLGDDAGAQRYAEDIEIHDNTIIGATAGGVRLGSEETGGVRRVTVRNNRIELLSPQARVGVLVDRHPRMPSLDNRVVDNKVQFSPNARPANAVRIDAQPEEACRALAQASVDVMVNGSCAIRVGGDCVGERAPAALRCDTRGR